jgi:predicted adenylyl cyclase CyaB
MTVMGEKVRSQYMNEEIERKFLMDGIPLEIKLNSLNKVEITQAYLFVDDKKELRIRKEGEKFLQTVKIGEGLRRREIEVEIGEHAFKELLGIAIGDVIEKTRYTLPYKQKQISIDVYHGKLEGLMIGEVEFGSEEDAKSFVSPSWFGKEVTGDKSYSNSTLAVSSDALESLLRKCSEKEKVPELELNEGIKWLINRTKELVSHVSGPVLVGIAGGSGSGKSEIVANKLKEAFDDDTVLLIRMDDYYRGSKYVEDNGLNFDQPEALNIDLLREHLRALKSGKGIMKPVYEKSAFEPIMNAESVEPKKVIIVEGLFPLISELANEMHVSAFVDVESAHGRIIRRLLRDSVKGKTSWSPLESVRYMLQTAEPMYHRYIEPTRKNADIIINNKYDPEKESIRTGMSEAQVKFRTKLNQEELRKIGAERLFSTKQTDYYYTPKNESFEKTGELLRIRKEGEKMILTYKGPKMNARDAIERQKFEIEIDGSVEAGMPSVYRIAPKIIEKDRTAYILNGILFTLDSNVVKLEKRNITELGNFIEIRIPQEKNTEKVDALKKILGVDSDSAILKSYFEM